jgi:inner membrane protein
MLFTVYNKLKVDRIFEASLKEQGFEYSRYMTSPTIFNNALWNGVAEGEKEYYHGMYSIFDESPKIIKFNTWPKNHELLEKYADDRDLKILKWFSNDYYNVLKNEKGELQLNDLRYGAFGNTAEKPGDFIFKFMLTEENGKLKARQARDIERRSDAFKELWERIKGI